MNFKIFLLIIAIIFVAQIQANDVEIEDVQENDQNQDKQSFVFDGEGSIEEQTKRYMEQMEQQQQQIKNMYAICIIASKSRIHGSLNQLQGLFSQHQDKNEIYRKIQAEHVHHCMTHATSEQFVQMAQEMNENTFEIQNHEQLFFELDFGRYEEQDFDFQLSEAEQQADKITIEFEEEWKQMSDQYQDSSDPLNQRGQYDISQFEPKIFGYSTKEIPSFAKILLILAVFTSFGGIIYYATLHLGQEKTITSKHQQKKQKKSQ